MSKKNHTYAVICPQPFTNRNNGKEAIIYNAVAGSIPNRNVVSPTIALSHNLMIDKKYEVQIEEMAPDEEWGRRFRFRNLGEWTKSVKEAIAVYGDPEIFNIEGSNAFTAIGGLFEEES